MKKQYFSISFFLIASWILVGNCGVALTSETYVKVPPKTETETETEVFRLNLLYGEVEKLYGVNVGLYNHAADLIGAQIGLLNTVHDPIGVQIGAINGVIAVHDIQTGLKIGLFNFGFILESNNPVDYLPKYRKISASVGLVNMMSGKLKLGLFNMGNDINLGIVNLHSDSKWTISIGAVNIGDEGNLQIGIVNYCPNNTIPVMIIANYCSKRSQPKPKINWETQPSAVSNKVKVMAGLG
ncbi:hypothetical protein LEP1GSC005_2060 [Leptospira santarosai str. ST188]|uniref:LA_2272/LA_2273 family lipoprotein n=1 Tax=Leptospira santarosai TaxID=28183 RepID=UPI0002BBC83A|nr:hypothetical protein [Leptospira santarosai]EMF92010.1 hypothetical protein LEP1GSC005_2060 [Leptospira santarosai str. ST188]